jgi:hypothetical protein
MTDVRPGDVLAVRTHDLAGWLIRLGAWLTHTPDDVNHIVVYSHTDAGGTRWGIEGRPGGVGWVDLQVYDTGRAGRIVNTNADQPKTDAQRQALVDLAPGMLGRAYDWESIGMDTFTALHIGALWLDRDEWVDDIPPAHVVCSSLAAWMYRHVGLRGPLAPTPSVTPAMWSWWNTRDGWAS